MGLVQGVSDLDNAAFFWSDTVASDTRHLAPGISHQTPDTKKKEVPDTRHQTDRGTRQHTPDNTHQTGRCTRHQTEAPDRVLTVSGDTGQDTVLQ